ncbi:RHS repeat-associated core domain-containing protein [Catenulispora pinisilvae]|uniref:RHS repeat-associated core domain-containing protein n=1 Tax=Catenulispora pinisilvae TaxID=2705253 RepID=UPI001891A210|nr:RHS repeat-associated core domain-containing protein [Catenulispora pinisilvae]
MARPTGWDILGLDGDPTPGVVESVQDLAKEFGDFAHDVESAYRSLNSFSSDSAALQWVGQTAEAFKSHYGPLPGRLQKLYTSYSEASDALSAYAPQLQAAQNKADSALRQAQDANVDLQHASTTANSAAADLKTAQQNHATSPNPQAVTDAQTAHDTAQTNLNDARARMAALTTQANQAKDDRINAAKDCAKALGHAQHDGIHNKSWWQHLGEDLSKWGGEIGKIAGELAPVLDVIALATSWIPGVDVVTAALAEADNIIAIAGTAVGAIGDAMQGHWGDALLGAGMLGLTVIGGRALGSGAEDLEGEAGALEGAEGAAGSEARSADGVSGCSTGGDPVDLVSGQMVTIEIDLELPGVLPVVLRRAYASGYDTGRLFGPGWSSTLDQRLSINDAGIHFAGDDGQILHYPLPVEGQQVLPVRGARWPLVWDRAADEIRIADPWSGYTWHFPVAHHRGESGQIRDVTAITDRNANRISILRDEDGTPTGLEHSGYRIAIDTAVTEAGPRIVGIRLLSDGLEDGITVKQFQYDDRNRLSEVIDSSGLPYTYEWDGADRITAWVDRVGYRYAYEYGPDGRVVCGIGDAGFLSASFEYRDEEHTTVLTDSLGSRTVYHYDENGHIAAVVDPVGNTITTVYDLNGNLLSRTDPLGATTRYERNAMGSVIGITAPDGAATTIERNALEQITVARMPDGAVWRRDYDERGNLVSIADPTGAVRSFTYQSDGAASGATDPLGAVVRIETNGAGLPIAATDPMGAPTGVERDVFGRVVSVVDPLGRRTEIGWTVEGRWAWQIAPDGARTVWTYDAEGRQLSVTGPTGSTTSFEPGPFGLSVARTGPDGLRHEFGYDTELRLVHVNNPGGGTWQYHYDAAGQLESETDFIGRTLDYQHDEAGRLISRTTGLGGHIAFDRDAAGRVVSQRTADGSFTYRYDAGGRLVAAVGPGTSIEYLRDPMGRVLAETVDGRTSTYAYDGAGRRTHRTTPSGAVSSWSFDAASRPISLQAEDHGLTFEYDVAGSETERHFGPGAWLSRGTDAAGRQSIQQLFLGDRSEEVGADQDSYLALDRSWSWRADGVPVEIQDSRWGARRFAANPAGRVTDVSGDTWNETYAYDAFGNLTYADTAGDDATGTREVNKTLIKTAGRTTYEHDAAGRLTRTIRRTLDGRRKFWHYTWDAQDRLIQAVGPDGADWRYNYDPLGRRTSKTRVSADGSTVEEILFVWDGTRLAEQSSKSHDGASVALTWDYQPGSVRPAAQRRRTSLPEAAQTTQTTVDEAFYAIVADLVGTPTELVTTEGQIAWQMASSLWGRTVAFSADPDVDCPLRFPGQYYDAETGLHYNLHRYYDPDTASYLSPDPLMLGAGPNDHAYVTNPLVFTDPLGLMCPQAAGGGRTLYRAPHAGNKDAEEFGPRPENHPTVGRHEGSAYFGDTEKVAQKYADQGTHEDGYWEYTMKPEFDDEFPADKYMTTHDNKPDEFQWIIPQEKIPKFNSLIQRSRWINYYQGHTWE